MMGPSVTRRRVPRSVVLNSFLAVIVSQELLSNSDILSFKTLSLSLEIPVSDVS